MIILSSAICLKNKVAKTDLLLSSRVQKVDGRGSGGLTHGRPHIGQMGSADPLPPEKWMKN